MRLGKGMTKTLLEDRADRGLQRGGIYAATAADLTLVKSAFGRLKS